MPERQSAGASVKRYSPELPYKPLVSPPSVEDKDACAIYASVRKDATPSHEPIELAIPALQKMLHRAGNVDGEGDGCGLLLDIQIGRASCRERGEELGRVRVVWGG